MPLGCESKLPLYLQQTYFLGELWTNMYYQSMKHFLARLVLVASFCFTYNTAILMSTYQVLHPLPLDL